MTVPASKVWAAGLLLVLVWLGAMLSVNISRPWTGHHDWNSTLWSQAAHNNLRAGLGTTLGAPSYYYYGPLPIPPQDYILHHPPGLPLTLTGVFALFGEREWAARLVPITCSLVSVVLLWLLVRSCVGVRAATLSALVFALLPMELYFGRMVSYDPVVLAWMLGALLSLRYGHLTGRRGWWMATLACVVAGMLTAWPMYIFAGVLAGLLLIGGEERGRRLAVVLVGLALVSASLFLLYIGQVRADAWQDLWQSFTFRTALVGGPVFSWGEWFERQYRTLGSHIPPLAWGLALVGGVYTAWKGRGSPGLRWLGWAALGLSLTAALFVVLFRNASFVHDYWGFYFVAPVAMMGGVALDALLRRAWSRDVAPLFRGACIGAAVAAVVLLGRRGYESTQALHSIDWWILDGVTEEPADLIPRLGETIYWTFPDETPVFCNFSKRGPHLEYYARRSISYDKFTCADWEPLLARPGQSAGGLVWLGAPGGEELWSALPQGRKNFVRFGGLRFGLWGAVTTPAADTAQPAVQTHRASDDSTVGEVTAQWSH